MLQRSDAFEESLKALLQASVRLLSCEMAPSSRASSRPWCVRAPWRAAAADRQTLSSFKQR
jgi:hypothetical protein